MAIIQMPARRAEDTALGSLSAGIGSGFSSGIESLINLKLQNMQKQQKVNSLSDSFKGLVHQGMMSEEEAPMFANMAVDSPQAFAMIMKDKMQQQQNRQYAEQRNREGGLGVFEGTPATPQEPQQFASNEQQQQKEPGLFDYDKLGTQESVKPKTKPYVNNPLLSPKANADEAARVNNQIFKEQQAIDKQAFTKAQNAQALEYKQAKHKENIHEKKIDRSLGKTQKYREGIDEKRDRAQEKAPIITRGIEIVRNRESTSSSPVKQTLAQLGWNPYALQKGSEVEFESLMNNLTRVTIQGMGSVRGKELIKIIRNISPNRFQSQEQQLLLLENQAKLNQLPIVKAKIKDQIMQEYEDRNEVPPSSTLSGKIEERMEPYYDEISDYFSGISDKKKVEIEEVAPAA
ncbi:MAG TPA: hypothetical protein VMV86_06605, partial [Methanosarcinales archaeon]|nr:hypothetical protein [Methanosarcinales archaeon]